MTGRPKKAPPPLPMVPNRTAHEATAKAPGQPPEMPSGPPPKAPERLPEEAPVRVPERPPTTALAAEPAAGPKVPPKAPGQPREEQATAPSSMPPVAIKAVPASHANAAKAPPDRNDGPGKLQVKAPPKAKGSFFFRGPVLSIKSENSSPQ